MSDHVSDAALVRQYGEHGWWEVATLPVHPALQPHVTGPYVGWREVTQHSLTRRENAGVVVPLIVSFGGEYTLQSSVGDLSPRQLQSFTAGVYDGWVDVSMPRDSCAMQINLTPPAARRIFGVPLTYLVNGAVPLDDVFGASGRALIEQLGNLESWSARAAIFDAFLLQRLKMSRTLPAAFSHAWNRLVATHGAARIADLQRDTSWSARRLGQAFRDGCGFTPRHVATIMRFERALTLATRAFSENGVPRVRPAWSTIAAEAGYADHAHLVRAFRQCAGVTPSAWLAQHSDASPRGEEP